MRDHFSLLASRPDVVEQTQLGQQVSGLLESFFLDLILPFWLSVLLLDLPTKTYHCPYAPNAPTFLRSNQSAPHWAWANGFGKNKHIVLSNVEMLQVMVHVESEVK